MGCGSGLDTIITTITWCALDTTIITITCGSASTITIDAKKRRAQQRVSFLIPIQPVRNPLLLYSFTIPTITQQQTNGLQIAPSLGGTILSISR